MEQHKAFSITYFYLVIFCIAWTPALKLVEGVPAVRGDDLLLLSFPLVSLYLFRKTYLDSRIWILFLIFISMLLGTLSGLYLGYPTSLGDISFVVRLMKYFGAVCLAIAIVRLADRTEALVMFLKASVLSGLGCSLIGIQQYFDLGGLNSKYVHLVAPTQFETLSGNYAWPRPVGMVGNPNEFGFLLVLLGFAGLYLWIICGRLDLRLKLCLILIFFASLLTMSRSAIFAGLIGVVVFVTGFFISAWSLKNLSVSKRRLLVTSLATVFFVSVIVISFSNSLIFETLVWRFTPEHFGSFYAREDSWERNYNGWLDSWFFGVGPLVRSGSFGVADNEHFLLLRTGGIFLYICVICLMVVGVLSKHRTKIAGLAQITLACSVLAYMVPAAAFNSLVIFPWLLMFLVFLAPLPMGNLRI